MIVTHKMTIDFSKRDVTPWVDAVQDDKYSRSLELSLYVDGIAWEPPSGAMAVVNYVKVDGTGGEYDTLPDGTAAYGISSNVLTVALAPQVLTVPGLVRLNVRLISEDRELNTFEILLNVQANVRSQLTGSEDYYNVSGFMARSGWTPNKYLGTDENGNVVEKEAPEGGGVGLTDEQAAKLDVISVSEDGYTDIAGTRQMTGFAVVRDGQTITLTLNLEGGETDTHVMTLDENDYPVQIISNGLEAPGSWVGFEATTLAAWEGGSY